MQLNAPISIFSRQKFAEGSALAPFRDDRNTPQAWKKSRKMAQQNNATIDALQQVVSKLSRQRRKPLGGFIPQVPQNFETVIPFGFYNVNIGTSLGINAPGTGYSANDVLTLSGGTVAPGGQPTQITIGQVGYINGVFVSGLVTQQGNYSVQPTFPNSPTGGTGSGLQITPLSNADSYRSVSMRDGLIGIRPRFTGFGQNQFQNPGNYVFGGTNVDFYGGGFQELLLIQGDNQLPSFEQPDETGQGQNGNSLIISLPDVDTVITGFDAVGNYFNFPLITFDVSQGTAGNLFTQAAFWLEINDTATTPPPPTANSPFAFVNLKCRIFLGDGSDEAFPIKSPNVIPLAIVYISNSTDFGTEMSITQLMTGNLINLFDSYFNIAATGASGLAAGTKTNWRGDWDADTLSGQFFYPGDLVTQGTIPTATTGGFSAKLLYVCLNYLQESTPPGSDATNWLCLTK